MKWMSGSWRKLFINNFCLIPMKHLYLSIYDCPILNVKSETLPSCFIRFFFKFLLSFYFQFFSLAVLGITIRLKGSHDSENTVLISSLSGKGQKLVLQFV